MGNIGYIYFDFIFIRGIKGGRVPFENFYTPQIWGLYDVYLTVIFILYYPYCINPSWDGYSASYYYCYHHHHHHHHHHPNTNLFFCYHYWIAMKFGRNILLSTLVNDLNFVSQCHKLNQMCKFKVFSWQISCELTLKRQG